VTRGTVESYLAGIGASAALLAGALVVFVILVGAATFDAWPPGGNPFSGRDDGATLNSAPTSDAPARASVPNLAKLLGGKQPAGRTVIVEPGTAARPQEPAINPDLGDSNGAPRPEGSRPQHAPAPSTHAPRTAPPSSEQNVVQQTVSNVGNTVESGTSTLGENLGGSTNPVGGLVGGLGSKVNDTLQGLAGNR
jgi:hypothetical protein